MTPLHKKALALLTERERGDNKGWEKDDVAEQRLFLLAQARSLDAYAMGPLWDLLTWNGPFARLFPEVETLPPEDLNLVWLLFGNDAARALVGDWDGEARRTLSLYRAEVAPQRDTPAVVALVHRLQTASAEFREWWPQYDVAGFETHRRIFDHPRAGRLEFETEHLVPVGAPDVRVVVHLSVDGDDSTARLARS